MVFILQIRRWTLPEAEQLIHNHALRKGQRQGLKLTTLVSRFSQCPLPRVSSESLLLPEPEEVRIEREEGCACLVYTYVQECRISSMERRGKVCCHGYAQPEQNIIHRLP